MTETTSLRERRLTQARKSLAATRETRERYLAMIARYTETIKRLERKIVRLEKPPRPQPAPAPKPAVRSDTAREQLQQFAAAMVADDMPDFLRRKKEGEAKDAAARAEILAEQEQRTKTKKRGGDERRAAARRGDTKRWPLTGKAALEAIRNG